MAARTPAGRGSDRRARQAARTVSGMRHSGGGWPVRRTLEAPMRGGPPWDRPTHATRQRQLRDEVKSGGSQPTYIRMIHRRSSAARRLNLDPMPVGAPPARFGTKHPVELVAESFGPARALRAVGTARGQRWRVVHRRPPLARLSPTSSTGSATITISGRLKTRLYIWKGYPRSSTTPYMLCLSLPTI